MLISELIERLKEKDQAAEVEFLVVKHGGELVTCEVGAQAAPMIKLLKMFKSA